MSTEALCELMHNLFSDFDEVREAEDGCPPLEAICGIVVFSPSAQGSTSGIIFANPCVPKIAPFFALLPPSRIYRLLPDRGGPIGVQDRDDSESVGTRLSIIPCRCTPYCARSPPYARQALHIRERAGLAAGREICLNGGGGTFRGSRPDLCNLPVAAQDQSEIFTPLGIYVRPFPGSGS